MKIHNKFPIYATQGGGYVMPINGGYFIFIEAPSPDMGLTIGDTLPEHWCIIPVNEKARQEQRLKWGQFR
jgi:hypothetical protein